MKKTFACIMTVVLCVFAIMPVSIGALDATRFITICYNNGQTVTSLNVDEANSEQVWLFQDEIQQLVDFLEGWIKKYKSQIVELKENLGNVNGDDDIDIMDAQIILAYYTEKNVAKKDVPSITEFAVSYGKE